MIRFPHKTCFIIGLNNFQSLSIVRNLNDYNIYTVGFDSIHRPITKFSNSLNKFIHYKDENELLELLIYYGQSLQTKVPIFCTRDHHCIFIDENKYILNKYYLYNWQKTKTIKEFINKKEMNELAIKSGLSTPKTFHSTDYDINIIKDKIVYPSIIKPIYTKPNIKGIIINSDNELEMAFKKQIFDEGYIIQEIIEGPETNIFVIGTYSDINGKIIAYGMGQTLRQNPSNFGTKTYLRSFDDKEILKITQQFLKSTQYYGIADIEFKYSTKDNSFKFIEINPRVGSINNFFCSQSIELPMICYDELTDHNIVCLKNNFKSIIWMDIHSDIKLLYMKNWLGRLSWLKELAQTNSFASFNVRDIKPFLYVFIQKIRRKLFS